MARCSIHKIGGIMKYNESFTKNNNPFNLKGAMGRLHFLGYNLLFMILSGIFLWHACPTFITKTATQSASQNKAVLELLIEYAPNSEIIAYTICTLVLLLIGFVLNKKRFLDILGETPNSLRFALIYSSVLFLLGLQSNFFTPQGSIQAGIISIGTILIYLFMYLKKGAITGKKEKTTEETQQEKNTEENA